MCPHASRSYGDPQQWAAFLGTPFLSGADGRLERVARIHKHPFYNLYTLDYDVALLELAVPVRRSRLVRPICLPDVAPRPPDGARCVITGWGSVREGGRRRPAPSGGRSLGSRTAPARAHAAPPARVACRLHGAPAAEGGRPPPGRAGLPPLLPGADQQPHAVRRLPAGRRGQLLGERTPPLNPGSGAQLSREGGAQAHRPGSLSGAELEGVKHGTVSALRFHLTIYWASVGSLLSPTSRRPCGAGTHTGCSEAQFC